MYIQLYFFTFSLIMLIFDNIKTPLTAEKTLHYLFHSVDDINATSACWDVLTCLIVNIMQLELSYYWKQKHYWKHHTIWKRNSTKNTIVLKTLHYGNTSLMETPQYWKHSTTGNTIILETP